MKTLQQLADEQGVSRQTIWSRTEKGKQYQKQYWKKYYINVIKPKRLRMRNEKSLLSLG